MYLKEGTIPYLGNVYLQEEGGLMYSLCVCERESPSKSVNEDFYLTYLDDSHQSTLSVLLPFLLPTPPPPPFMKLC